ncbi:unnamed protein product [Oppiella nova]|uniref:26S proteasome non-ATPase regulatory subunit 4 n=1 Tax=Oppiella nova TaxID=334625 RepID=A0A7R9QI99_9ACAR|nr:unnamed protein product [Oppiella nova]CAG2165888.1 unnamed protein product [Oppiella nova]
MRNGDFVPTRLQAQQDAVSMVCHSKTRSNPENNVGLLTLAANPQVLSTLTTDVGRILSKLHAVEPIGEINLMTGIRVAHLALKHRQGKNHKMRIVVFVGSPVDSDEKELIKLAKRLKKEKVNVDVVNFGEEQVNTDKLTAFIKALEGTASHLVTVPPGPHLSDALISSPVIQGEDGSGAVKVNVDVVNFGEEQVNTDKLTAFIKALEGTASHLVTVPPGPHLSDALISSPVIQGEDGSGAVGIGSSGFEFGIDPNEDPELALALRVSMEEQRQRTQQDVPPPPTLDPNTAGGSAGAAPAGTSIPQEDALLEKALAMSLEADEDRGTGVKPPMVDPSAMPDFATMTEEEQIAYAMQMSLQHAHDSSAKPVDSPVPMETDDTEDKTENKDK